MVQLSIVVRTMYVEGQTIMCLFSFPIAARFLWVKPRKTKTQNAMIDCPIESKCISIIAQEISGQSPEKCRNGL